MVRAWILVLSALLVTSCSQTAAPKGPDLVGKVSSQPGNCYYRDATGKLFISPCK